LKTVGLHNSCQQSAIGNQRPAFSHQFHLSAELTADGGPMANSSKSGFTGLKDFQD
jgi:hypothetical protein